ncbi:conserved hypothetical protein [Pediculus humanus corporis]|uniref:Uncharacterized protein n=1 Tax=Pediculus humanus subsp. corporis TaxID=121224 RepID=E0VG08_PEDHC|nr:uncharacterized protein Phum_PHUM170230 [Pediculus humanus corporis]EEB12314.1 conserved hypothetical protein [Pediculus humanus corporis]
MHVRGSYFNKMAEGTINMIFWFLVLVFLSYWIACMCFIPYLIVSIFVPCVPDLKVISDMLLKGLSFPYICSDNMVNRRGLTCG